MDWWIYLIIGLAVLLILLLTFIFIYLYKKKSCKNKIDSNFMASLVLYLGGINNILKVEVEQSRLKIEVSDLDLVDLEKLKTLTDKGIFVTGNTIKALFKDDAIAIKNNLMKR